MDEGIAGRTHGRVVKIMKLGIMQPYIFPYIGYFQLIKAVEKFVCYDDVAFIKQGWINRNRILINGQPFVFTIPLHQASSYTLIKDTMIDEKKYEIWKKKFYKTLEQNYRKANYFDETFAIVKQVLDEKHDCISMLASSSIEAVCKYLSINTYIQKTSVYYSNEHLKAESRIINICKQEYAKIYVNVAGGFNLYSRDNFLNNDIVLQFIKYGDIRYTQFKEPFCPWLSIIDVMMFNSVERIQEMLKNREIL